MRNIQDILKGTIRKVKSSNAKRRFQSNLSLIRLTNKTKALVRAMNMTVHRTSNNREIKYRPRTGDKSLQKKRNLFNQTKITFNKGRTILIMFRN